MAIAGAAKGCKPLAACLRLFVPCTELCVGAREAEVAAALQVAGAGGGVKLGVIEKAQVGACLAQPYCGSRLHTCLKRGTSDWGGLALTGLLTALQTAVNTLKVASALNNISGMLKVGHRTHMPAPWSGELCPAWAHGALFLPKLHNAKDVCSFPIGPRTNHAYRKTQPST